MGWLRGCEKVPRAQEAVCLRGGVRKGGWGSSEVQWAATVRVGLLKAYPLSVESEGTGLSCSLGPGARTDGDAAAVVGKDGRVWPQVVAGHWRAED